MNRQNRKTEQDNLDKKTKREILVWINSDLSTYRERGFPKKNYLYL